MSSPSWPSLYNPAGEINPNSEASGIYIFDSNEVFRFTLIWNLVLYTPIFVVCGVYAFLNLSFPPSRGNSIAEDDSHSTSYPLSPLSPISPSYRTSLLKQQQATVKPPKPNERRSRLTFALLVLLAFITLSVAGAVIGAAVVGYILAGLFNAGNFNMSTWVPFLWVVIQILIGLLSLQSSIIDII
ncbi:hypothetical protein CCMSSC00406_0004407 [Pleurotus cornucopiae]|uniref:Uncharacterized protein n=1 Tax=Pleurotus cornucopiae TaxID=5321 RepID=A0ACB7J0A0_PLECO|nr:hypothetical protein CCMSSC00406_0004407 [Pleurotus cornucopiae]